MADGDLASALETLQARSFDQATQATRSSYPPSHRLRGDDLVAFLSRRKYLVVATARADGRPHAALSSFVLRADGLWLPTESGIARARALRATPFAFAVVTEGEDEQHTAVLAEGPVELVDDGGEPPAVRAEWARRFGHEPSWAHVWIRLEPTKLFSYRA